MTFSYSSVLGGPFFLLLACAVELYADVPVDGDAELITAVKGAQAAHRSSLQEGTLKCRVRERRGESCFSSDILFSWGLDNSRIDFDMQMPVPNKPGTHTAQVGVAILQPARLDVYYASSFLAQKIEKHSKSLQPSLDWHPRSEWYSYQRLLPWERLLDYEKPQGSVSKFVVREEGDEIVIQRHHPNGARMTIVASKKQELNITSYFTEGTEDIFCGEAEWKSTHSNSFYPTVFRYWRYAAKSDKGEPVFEMVAEDFSPTLEGQRHRLEWSSISLPTGTRIESVDASGRRSSVSYVGGESGKKEYRLKILAKGLRRSGGFLLEDDD